MKINVNLIILISLFLVIGTVLLDKLPNDNILNDNHSLTEKCDVLIIAETNSYDKLPAEQRLILQSDEVKQFLEDNFDDYRIIDPNDNNLEQKWIDAKNRPTLSLPKILISDGKIGIEGPLPPTIDATLDLLKKWVKK